jgi:hypothetical protein
MQVSLQAGRACALLAYVLLSSPEGGLAEPAESPASFHVSETYTPGARAGQGTWVLGAVMIGYTNVPCSPIFMETFDDYAPGSVVGQGPWVRNSSFSAFHDIDKIGPVVSAGDDQHAGGDLNRDTAATCFFPDIFANGNAAGRVEFDFRRGCLELDFRLGPAVEVNGVASNVISQSIGGQFAGYGGGCFTAFFKGGFDSPRIIYRPWQPGTFYHMVMDLVKTGTVVTVRSQIDGIPLGNLSGPVIPDLTAPQGINSLTFRGADNLSPVYAFDNIKVSVPFKPGGLPPSVPWSIIP